VQFRYAFVVDAAGLHVVDVTDPARAHLVPGATVAMDDLRDVYVARTYAYVAAGAHGLVIVDVERPEHPVVDQTYTAGGAIDDARAVKVGMANAGLFAYVADGRHGLRVIQLTSPDTPGATGFSPRPRPDWPEHGLIATYPTHGPAVGLSRGLDRDRAVDESGNQLAVFGRRGARPFTLAEQQRLYRRDGAVWTVPALRTDADVRRAFGTPR
jgi:LVIVD repeat-containing protein